MTDERGVTTTQLALRAAEDGLAAYASNPALRAVVTVIPFVGGGFDAILGTAGSNVALDRLRILVEELSHAVDRVAVERRDSNVITDQLLDAAIRAVRGATETANREKVRMIAAALVGATSVDRPSELDAESALASLISLTSADLAFARMIAGRSVDQRYAVIDFKGIDPGPDAQFRLMRLQGAGLIDSMGSGGGLGAGPKLSYRFTPTMWRILDLLRAGGELSQVEG